MDVQILLLANSILLLFILVVLVLFIAKNKKPEKKSRVREDLKKIKDQINSNS